MYNSFKCKALAEVGRIFQDLSKMQFSDRKIYEVLIFIGLASLFLTFIASFYNSPSYKTQRLALQILLEKTNAHEKVLKVFRGFQSSSDNQ